MKRTAHDPDPVPTTLTTAALASAQGGVEWDGGTQQEFNDFLWHRGALYDNHARTWVAIGQQAAVAGEAVQHGWGVAVGVDWANDYHPDLRRRSEVPGPRETTAGKPAPVAIPTR